MASNPYHMEPGGLWSIPDNVRAGIPVRPMRGAVCYVCDEPCPPASATGREVPVCARCADESKTPPAVRP